jgi:hypothetical protein
VVTFFCCWLRLIVDFFVVASLPLFGCTITFFSQFGQFLCLTIAFSWLFANFFFMSLLATFGDTPATFREIWANDAAFANGAKGEAGASMT